MAIILHPIALVLMVMYDNSDVESSFGTPLFPAVVILGLGSLLVALSLAWHVYLVRHLASRGLPAMLWILSVPITGLSTWEACDIIWDTARSVYRSGIIFP